MEGERKKFQNGKVIEEKFVVEYEKELYDITSFISKHPGGISTLENLNRKDIELKFKNVEHSKAAEYLLREYKVQKNPQTEHLDDSMEHLVNWDEGMIKQISSLGDKYSEWVNLPVDRPLKLFDNKYIESISKTPWYIPLLVWVPAIVFLTLHEAALISDNKIFAVITNLISGVCLWTFLEYTLHRYLFHMNVELHPKLATLHFLIHGLHHKVPFDELRLVFPPVPAFFITIILYQPVLILYYLNIIAYPRLMLAGGLSGYLIYDMIHYYLHHGNPQIQYFYKLKRYHSYHHFIHHDKGFGISNTFWDQIFDTEIFLKKLKYALRW